MVRIGRLEVSRFDGPRDGAVHLADQLVQSLDDAKRLRIVEQGLDILDDRGDLIRKAEHAQEDAERSVSIEG